MDSMKTKQTVINVLIQVIMILVSITMLVPFLWMILTAFKTVTEATSEMCIRDRDSDGIYRGVTHTFLHGFCQSVFCFLTP